jgi:DNA-binding transcriptional MerR regulator
MMKSLAVSEAAVALNVSPSSIRNWTDNPLFKKFFSEMARREGSYAGSEQRTYHEEDLYVLNTISKHKTRTNTFEVVRDMLEEGFRDMDLPPSAALVLIENQADAFQALVAARVEIQGKDSLIKDLREEIRLEREQRRESESSMNRTIARLELLLELEKEKNNGKKPE